MRRACRGDGAEPHCQAGQAALSVETIVAIGFDSDPLQPPWPDVLIATGRQSVASSLAVKAASPTTFRIQIQDPGVRASLFDMVVVPRHDRLRGDNVLVTKGALHRVTPQIIAEAAERLASTWDNLPRPRIAVLIGGTNGCYTMTTQAAMDLADKLAALSRDTGAGLLVTTSRRTGAENEEILRDRLANLPATLWDGSGENPYFAFLGLADAIVVTPDSVNMVCEACTTGKPVFVTHMPGGSRKFNAFHAALLQDGITRRFEGRLETWTYPPLDDTARAASEAWSRIRAK